MRRLAEECVPAWIVEGLRRDGHDVAFAMESLQGYRDEHVLTEAVEARRVLVTEDKDFGDLVMRGRLPAWGVVLLRFPSAVRAEKQERLRWLLQAYADRLPGAFVVLTARHVRFRALPS